MHFELLFSYISRALLSPTLYLVAWSSRSSGESSSSISRFMQLYEDASKRRVAAQQATSVAPPSFAFFPHDVIEVRSNSWFDKSDIKIACFHRYQFLKTRVTFPQLSLAFNENVADISREFFQQNVLKIFRTTH